MVSIISVVLTMALSFCAAIGDMNFANSYRNFAHAYYSKYKDNDNDILYVGQWGFDYYLLKLGAIPIQCAGKYAIHKGDAIFIPSFPWPQPIPEDLVNNICLVETVTINTSFPVYTMNGEAKAFFWANYNFPNYHGVLPFSFGTKIPVEQFYVYQTRDSG